MIYTVKDFFIRHQKSLGLRLICSEEGFSRRIKKPQVHRPGLSLTGNIKSNKPSRILVFGRGEIQYLKELDKNIRYERLKDVLTSSIPCVVLSKNYAPLREIKHICEKEKIPLFSSSISTLELISKMIIALHDEFSPTVSLHGTLVEVFGVGVLIQGESAVGKSEAALGLLDRGHRLISDDIVKIRKKEDDTLIGFGPSLTRHLMEIRGVGIINVAHLHGAICVRPDKVLDIIIKLENWNTSHFYDRGGLDDKVLNILGVNVPFHVLPVKPGRDVVLLIETITLNYRLKSSGYNSAREFNKKLLTLMNKNKRNLSENDKESKSTK